MLQTNWLVVYNNQISQWNSIHKNTIEANIFVVVVVTWGFLLLLFCVCFFCFFVLMRPIINIWVWFYVGLIWCVGNIAMQWPSNSEIKRISSSQLYSVSSRWWFLIFRSLSITHIYLHFIEILSIVLFF